MIRRRAEAPVRLNPELERRLEAERVRVETADGDTLLLRNVPTRAERFSKPRTNVLIKRPQPGLPFLYCVDEDLDYTGDDGRLARAFAGGTRQKGWRVLYLGEGAPDAAAALERALAALGFAGEPTLATAPPAAAGAAEGADLQPFARCLTPLAESGRAEPCVGREEALDELLIGLRQRRPRLAVVLGDAGVGKSNLLAGLAERLAAERPPRELWASDLGVLFAGTLLDAERENLLAELLRRCAARRSEVVLALEHVERLFVEAPRAPFLLGEALDRGLHALATAWPACRPLLDHPALSGRLRWLELHEAGPGQTLAVLAAWRGRVGAHHGVELPEALLAPALERAGDLAGRLPGKALALLDAAAARAAAGGAREVELVHVYLAAQSFSSR